MLLFIILNQLKLIAYALYAAQLALPYSTSQCLLYTDPFTTITCTLRLCTKEPKSIFDPQHLLTCTIDGKEINNVENCIERLKMMDAQSQVWGQDMLLQIKENKLLLTDIEAEVNRASVYFISHPIWIAIFSYKLGQLRLNI